MKNVKNRKGFTLIELTVTVALMAMLTIYFYIKTQDSYFYTEVKKATNEISGIIERGVMNDVTGYANGTGGDCSTGYDYVGLTAKRMNDCTGLFVIDPLSPKVLDPNGNGDDASSVTKILTGFTNENGSIYLRSQTWDTFEVFIDFSMLILDDRKKAYIEDHLTGLLRDKFSTSLVGIDLNAVSFVASTGNVHDGMLLLFFKK